MGANSGYPYGIGLGVGKGDMTGVVGDESSVDNKQQFLPLTKPVQVRVLNMSSIGSCVRQQHNHGIIWRGFRFDTHFKKNLLPLLLFLDNFFKCIKNLVFKDWIWWLFQNGVCFNFLKFDPSVAKLEGLDPRGSNLIFVACCWLIWTWYKWIRMFQVFQLHQLFLELDSVFYTSTLKM